MNFTVHITKAAERDMNGAADYIEYVLLNPEAADSLLDEAEEKISKLSLFPEKYAVVDDPVLKTWEIRFLTVKNYLAFYVIHEEENKIFLVRFLYSKRDWISILKQGFSLH